GTLESFRSGLNAQGKRLSVSGSQAVVTRFIASTARQSRPCQRERLNHETTTGKSSPPTSAKPVGVGAGCQAWIPTGEQSGLLMRIGTRGQPSVPFVPFISTVTVRGTNRKPAATL